MKMGNPELLFQPGLERVSIDRWMIQIVSGLPGGGGWGLHDTWTEAVQVSWKRLDDPKQYRLLSVF